MRVDHSAMVNQAAGIRAKKVHAAEEVAPGATDSLLLSSRAADVRTAMDALASAPGVREDRVRELSQQLEQGTLTQDGDSLAHKLLDGR